MAKRRKRYRMKKSTKIVITVILLLISIVGGWLIVENNGVSVGGGSGGGGSSSNKDSNKENSEVVEGEGDPVKIYFIDVGQADCTVICTNEGNMIIDAGSNSSEEEMLAYINKLKITEFKYAIFTHPHEDHIGGAEKILENYRVENVLIPDYEATTKVYTKMLEAIDESGSNVEVIEAGENFEFAIGDLKAKVLAPIQFDKNVNNASIVTRVDYGETSIMFTGDAEGAKSDDPEKLILEKYKDNLDILDCDIYKLGHHGSSTSSSQEFLDAVTPEISIISCGLDNDYGHPHEEVIDRLEKAGIEYYRTDELGTIILTVYKNGYKISENKISRVP